MGKTYKILILLLIVFYAIDPYSYGFVFGYITALILLINSSHLKSLFDSKALVLLIFSISYACFYSFSPDLGTQFIFIYSIIPTTFYLSGRIIYNLFKNELYRFYLLILLGVSFSFTSMVSVFNAIIQDGFITIERNVPLIWTGIEIPATNMAASFVLNMCIPGILLIGFKKLNTLFPKLILIVIYSLSITCILRLGSRTHLVITLISLITALIYKFKKQNMKQNLFLFFGVFISLNLLISYISLDQDSDIFAAYADRMDSKTNGLDTAGGRTWKWEKSIEFMFTKPIGWELNEIGYAHNLWFDVLRVSGVIGFFLLLFYTFQSIKIILNLLKLNNFVSLENGQLILYCVAFLLLFFVEPIMEGYFTTFSIFCLIIGFSSEKIKNFTAKQNS